MQNPVHGFTERFCNIRGIQRGSFYYAGIFSPSRPYQTAVSAESASSANIFCRISNDKRPMKINGMFFGREFVKEGSGLLALARLAKPMRANVRTYDFRTAAAKIRSESPEPLKKLVC
jgi:hypothetical protein